MANISFYGSHNSAVVVEENGKLHSVHRPKLAVGQVGFELWIGGNSDANLKDVFKVKP